MGRGPWDDTSSWVATRDDTSSCCRREIEREVGRIAQFGEFGLVERSMVGRGPWDDTSSWVATRDDTSSCCRREREGEVGRIAQVGEVGPCGHLRAVFEGFR